MGQPMKEWCAAPILKDLVPHGSTAEPFTLGNLKLIAITEKAPIPGRISLDIKVSFKRVNAMAKAGSSGPTGRCMKAHGGKKKFRVTVS